MVQFQVKNEEIKEWLPETYKSFMEELRGSKSRAAKKREDKIKWFVSWGYFGKKAKTDEEKAQKEKEYEDKLHLTYEDRLKEDTPKISIYVYMKAGFYERSDKSLDVAVPQYIVDMSQEILKQTMLKEQIFVKDEAVQDSIKEWKYMLRDIIELDENDDPILDAKGRPIPVIPFEMDEETGLPKMDPETGLPVMKKKKDGEKKVKEAPLNMDGILDKISDSGMSSLTPRELEYLEKMSRS
jgi:hypothetical protein